MRTTTPVHNAAERVEMRVKGDRRARVCQVGLLCVMSILRVGLTEIVPLCGSAAWWVLAVCLLPAAAFYALACYAMRRTGTETLTEAARALLGAAGVWALSLLWGVLLLLDGAASMTALVTSFTEGIGTQGTQVTMAGVTLLALLFCLHRDGLAWGIYFMRLALLAIAACLAAGLAGLAAPDHLHPLLGQGRASILSALRVSASVGWPLLLLADTAPPRPRRAGLLLPPVLLAVGGVLLVCLAFPNESLVQESTLAGRLLQPVFYLPQALRTLAHSLMMLLFFLSIATASQLAADRFLTPKGRELPWLAGVVAAIVAGTQLAPIRALWRLVTLGLVWLPALLTVLILLLNVWRKPCVK